MKLIFRWHEVGDKLGPCCIADIDLVGGFSPIARLLDCGVLGSGQNLDDWLRGGIRLTIEAEQLPTGATPYDWGGSECWAEISADLTCISYSYDSRFEETLHTKDFRIALEKWRDFLQLGPTSVVREHMIESLRR